MTRITNSRIIAEGVETQEEYSAIQSLGISFAQGYYFEKPTRRPSRRISSEIFLTNQRVLGNQDLKKSCIESIVKPVAFLQPETTNKMALKYFQDNPKETLVPVVGANRIDGLLYKDQFLTKLFASPYGLDLHGEKRLVDFIDCSSLTFDVKESIQAVSNQLTNSNKDYQAFIITRDGKYAGVATVIELLEVITNQQLQSAKYSNPLTQLPGITPLNNNINALLKSKSLFSVAYIDLDNFKPYNDVYGYEKGDLVIKTLAEELNKVISSHVGTVGHIGGDDFIALFYFEKPQVMCQELTDNFSRHIPTFYNNTDLQSGGITAKGRNGNLHFFPLISLSIGIVNYNTLSESQTHLEIADLLTEAKMYAKKTKGNSIYVNQKVCLRKLAI